MKISSIVKSLIYTPQRNSNKLPHWRDETSISPKDAGDISGLVLPRVTSNRISSNINIEYLSKIYECHDLVYSSIDLVSTTFALGELKVKKLIDGKYKFVPEHPLQKLLDNPNPTMSGFDLRQSFIVHRLLYGSVSFILVRGEMIIDNTEANRCPACYEGGLENCYHILWAFHQGPIIQIMPVHLDRLETKWFDTPKGKKEFHVYNFNNGVEMPIHPDNLLIDPKYNPSKSSYGTSPTAVVERWLELDLGLTEQIGAYFANNAIPSFFVNLKPPKDGSRSSQNPKELLQQMKDGWMNTYSMTPSARRRGRNSEPKSPAFVYGDFDIKQIQDALKDIVIKPLFYEIQNRIAMVYKVPPSFFEFGLNYSDTVKQQNEDFYNRAISPELKTFKKKIERYVLPVFSDYKELKLVWNLSDMGVASFLQDKEKAQILSEWERGLITRDTAREDLGRDPIGNEFGDDLYRMDVLGNTPNNSNVNNPSNRSSEDNILNPRSNQTLNERASTQISKPNKD